MGWRESSPTPRIGFLVILFTAFHSSSSLLVPFMVLPSPMPYFIIKRPAIQMSRCFLLHGVHSSLSHIHYCRKSGISFTLEEEYERWSEFVEHVPGRLHCAKKVVQPEEGRDEGEADEKQRKSLEHPAFAFNGVGKQDNRFRGKNDRQVIRNPFQNDRFTVFPSPSL